jgi:hypothetical protein
MKRKMSLTTSDVSEWMRDSNLTELQKRRLLRTLLSLPGVSKTSSVRNETWNYYYTKIALLLVLIVTMLYVGNMYNTKEITATTDPNFSILREIPIDTECSGSRSEIAVAIGIISALHNRELRDAARETWLTKLDKNMEYKFFLGVKNNGFIPPEVRAEATKYRDMIFTGAPDDYESIGFRVVSIFQWGVEQCGAHYVVRANDDVYLRLNKIFDLLRRFPPVNLIAGHIFQAGAAIVIRPSELNYECRNEAECKVREKTRKNQAVTVGTYPSDTYAAFAQGNAIILSRDLSEEIASLIHKPYFTIYCDDVMIGTMVSRFHPRYVHIKADMSLHESSTVCSNDATNHFDIGPQSIRILFDNDNNPSFNQCHGIDAVFVD